jgi:hypothetical protein
LTTQKKQKKSKSRRSNLSFFIDAYRVGSWVYFLKCDLSVFETISHFFHDRDVGNLCNCLYKDIKLTIY